MFVFGLAIIQKVFDRPDSEGDLQLSVTSHLFLEREACFATILSNALTTDTRMADKRTNAQRMTCPSVI